MAWDRFDIVEAYYWYCVDYHGGQWSKEYSRLCRIGGYYSPGPLHKGFISLSNNAKEIYKNLEQKGGF